MKGPSTVLPPPCVLQLVYFKAGSPLLTITYLFFTGTSETKDTDKQTLITYLWVLTVSWQTQGTSVRPYLPCKLDQKALQSGGRLVSYLPSGFHLQHNIQMFHMLHKAMFKNIKGDVRFLQLP